jgi:ketopantoate reductase
MKTLILGAGVIGSFNAARLRAAGQDVTLLARGRRLADLREYGIVLEGFRTGRRTMTRVPLVDWLAPEDAYDLAIVAMRPNQIPSILPVLAQNHRIPRAWDEMKELADELRVILRQSGLPSPASDILFAQVEAQFQASRSGLSTAPPSLTVA